MSSQTPAHLENKVEDSTAGTKDKKVASSAAAAPSVAAEPAKPAPAKSAAKQPIRLKPNNPIAKIKRPVAVKSSSKQGTWLGEHTRVRWCIRKTLTREPVGIAV